MPTFEQTTRGVKRKRVSDKDSEGNKEAKLRRKLHHALRELRKVVKKARTFEVQKTLKKLKDARRKNQDDDLIRDLEAQMEILKHLNYDQLATSALLTKLKKDKPLFADPTMQTVSAELITHMIPPGAPGTPTARVQSRMLSSKVISSEAVSIIECLRLLLHPIEGSGNMDQAADKVPGAPTTAKKFIMKTDREKDAVSLEVNSMVPSGARRDDEDDENDDTSGVEAVAEPDDGWESGTVDVPSESDDPVGGVADDHETCSVGSADVVPPSKNSLPHGSKSHSEFLPSLSVGFARGDSDSEFSDSESRFLDGRKKNRRGQRARRAIWEKKYGKNANHVKKKQQGSSSAQFRRTPMQSRAGHDQLHRPKSDGIKGFKAHTQTKDDIRGKQVEPPLHPSWEAKRKSKSASIVPSQGTKIVFSGW